jgi:hypothetical protein
MVQLRKFSHRVYPERSRTVRDDRSAILLHFERMREIFRIGLISMGVKLHTTLFRTRITAVRKARPFSLEGLFRADDFLTIALERLV